MARISCKLAGREDAAQSKPVKGGSKAPVRPHQMCSEGNKEAMPVATPTTTNFHKPPRHIVETVNPEHVASSRMHAFIRAS